MTQSSSGPKSSEERELERLKAELLLKREQLDKKAQGLRRQIVDAMRDRQDRLGYYQDRLAKVERTILEIEQMPPTLQLEVVHAKLLASREIFEAGAKMSEIQMRDHKVNYELINSPNPLELNVANSSRSFNYNLAKARTSLATSQLVLLDFKLPLEILEQVMFNDPSTFVDPPEEEAMESVEPFEENDALAIAEETIEASEENDEAAEAETIDDLSIADLIDAEEPPAEEEKRPLASELLTADYRLELRAFLDANPQLKLEVGMAFGYYREAMQIFEEADSLIRELRVSKPGPEGLKQLAGEGETLLAKLKGKLFYLNRLPERMVDYPQILEMLPQKDAPEPAAFEKAPSRSSTRPLQGNWTKPLGSTAPLSLAEDSEGMLESIVEAEAPEPGDPEKPSEA